LRSDGAELLPRIRTRANRLMTTLHKADGSRHRGCWSGGAASASTLPSLRRVRAHRSGAAAARLAEELGLDAVSFGDHPTLLDCWVWLAAAAAATHRIHLGPGVDRTVAPLCAGARRLGWSRLNHMGCVLRGHVYIACSANQEPGFLLPKTCSSRVVTSRSKSNPSGMTTPWMPLRSYRACAAMGLMRTCVVLPRSGHVILATRCDVRVRSIKDSRVGSFPIQIVVLHDEVNAVRSTISWLKASVAARLYGRHMMLRICSRRMRCSSTYVSASEARSWTRCGSDGLHAEVGADVAQGPTTGRPAGQANAPPLAELWTGRRGPAAVVLPGHGWNLLQASRAVLACTAELLASRPGFAGVSRRRPGACGRDERDDRRSCTQVRTRAD
jgi:Luciferase-like monooxygenase